MDFQNRIPAEELGGFVTLDHIVVLVSELERSLPYYETLLPLIGFSKRREHVFGNAEGLSIDIRQAPEPGHAYRRLAPGLNHLGFRARDREALSEVALAMGEAGFEVPRIQAFEDGYALFFKDPDGMRLELSCYA